MFRAEMYYQEIFTYAEYNRTCFEVVAATSRDISRSVARHDARHRFISGYAACFELKFIIRRFLHTLNTTGRVSKL